MKHFLENGQIFAFEADGSQDHLITVGMVLQTAEQVAAFLAPTQEQLDAEEQERTLAELTQIDAASVRSLREFVLAKFAADPELPPYLADHDAAAQIKRGKLK